jgi:hypothetical protein
LQAASGVASSVSTQEIYVDDLRLWKLSRLTNDILASMNGLKKQFGTASSNEEHSSLWGYYKFDNSFFDATTSSFTISYTQNEDY